MSTNNGHKQSPSATLSSVTAEMAKPRVAESAKQAGDTLTNTGHRAAAPSATKTPVPRDHGAQPLQGEELSSHMSLVSGWELVHDHHIVRNFEFPDFRSALAFVVQIGEIAEEQQHHPDILLGWGKVQATTWTHDVNGLSENDFILAGKINQIPR
jgi:4a-hydroxytetrahydrobiopterin dehydratase